MKEKATGNNIAATVRCNSPKKATCPFCGDLNIVAQNSDASHCGSCGRPVKVEYTETYRETEPPAQETSHKKENLKKEPPTNNGTWEYVQMTLFD